MDKAILTCALTGVLTDPKQHPVPVTAQEMAAAAREAYNAGASIMHVHLRQQAPGMGGTMAAARAAVATTATSVAGSAAVERDRTSRAARAASSKRPITL